MPLQGVCDPVTGNTPLMYAAMENKVIMLIMVMMNGDDVDPVTGNTLLIVHGDGGRQLF